METTLVVATAFTAFGQAEGDSGLLRQFEILRGMAEAEAYEVLVRQLGAGHCGSDGVPYDA